MYAIILIRVSVMMRHHRNYGMAGLAIFQRGGWVSLEKRYSKQCIDSIKGKYAKTIKKGATRSSGILELIHTDICGPFPITSVDGFDSFIMFTNDFFCYDYIYPISDRSESLEKFKIFKSEVEN
jgi:hypothetical protein